MAFNKSRSDAAVINNSELALQNSINQPDIAGALTTFGMTTERIAEGQQKLQTARQKFDFNKQEDDETHAAAELYQTKLNDFQDSYSMHRRLSKAVFRNDNVTAESLCLMERNSRTIAKQFQSAVSFYDTALCDESISTKTALLGLTVEKLTVGKTLLEETIAARGD